MKKEVGPVVVIAVVLVAVGAVVGLWFWQPLAPKVYGLTPPTHEERQRATQQMTNDMREAMQHRPGMGGPR